MTEQLTTNDLELTDSMQDPYTPVRKSPIDWGPVSHTRVNVQPIPRGRLTVRRHDARGNTPRQAVTRSHMPEYADGPPAACLISNNASRERHY